MAKIQVVCCAKCGKEIVDQETEIAKCLNPECPLYNQAVAVIIVEKEVPDGQG